MNLREQIQHKIDNKTKPQGSLGRLEELALKIGEIQNTQSPEIKNPAMLVFAADHGLADEGVSPFPKEVTAQMVLNFLNGGAAINVFCRQNGIDLKVIDAGVDFDFPESESLVNAKIRKGTTNMLHGVAMSREECEEALNKGREQIDTAHANGTNIIGFGEMGIGNTSPASLLMHKFCNIPIEDCVGMGAGLNSDGVTRKLEILKKVTEQHGSVSGAKNILATFGGFEIAMMAGAVLRAAELGMIILVDGFIATSALLAAYHINNNVLKNSIFCHQSKEPGHKLVLEYLKAEPLLDLNLRLGEGTGAAIALPIVQAAVNFLNEMASFEDAGVSNRD